MKKVMAGTEKVDEYEILRINTAPFCTKDVWLEQQLSKSGIRADIPDVNYIAIELVSTTPTETLTLSDAIKNNALVVPDGSDEMTETLAVVMQICLGLQTAQDILKFAHNDLHLKNILVQGLDPLMKAMSDFGLSLPSKSGVNVYYPEFKMTVYTANIPIIIDFGKSRLEVSERLRSAMESNSEADILAALNNPQKGEPTIPVNATDELVNDVHWGGFYGYTHKFNSANDIFMVVGQIAEFIKVYRPAMKPNPVGAIMHHIFERAGGIGKIELIDKKKFHV